MLIKIIALKRFIIRNKVRIKDKIDNAGKVLINQIEKLKDHMPLKKCLKLLQLDFSFYLKLRQHKKCTISLLNQCIVKHPMQLLSEEVQEIKKYLTCQTYLLWPLNSVFHQMRRDGVGSFSKNTFYKYASLLNLKKLLPAHRRSNHLPGIRADRPFELLHIDITRFVCKNSGVVFIHVIRDNFSRAILHTETALRVSAVLVSKSLQTVFEKYLQHIKLPLQIMSDGGPENNCIKDWIHSLNDCLEVNHITAQLDVAYSNSMVEAAIRILKYYGLYQADIPDPPTLIKELNKAVADYNRRPNDGLNGLTPFEVLNGKIYTDIFTEPSVDARSRRIRENKTLKCCSYSF
jgi:putative transposase